MNETELFRKMELSEDGISQMKEFKEKHKVLPSSYLAVVMSENKFQLEEGEMRKYKLERYQKDKIEKENYSYAGFVQLKNSYRMIFDDLKYFPIPLSKKDSTPDITFENSWMFERNYGGTRGHEGTDLMAGMNKRDLYPILSMTAGVVEKIGWLEQGGYRIGIRSPHGGYFYYAHLSKYAKDFKEGDVVLAGEILGYMGDTGYSKIEGETGHFPVHLHLGIYIGTQNNQELSVNPYWILKYLEDQRIYYDF